MTSLQANEFNIVLHDLRNYGQKGYEEIHFCRKGGNCVPVVIEKPNWLFRIIRWLFQGGYHETKEIKKVIRFLEANHALLCGDKNHIDELRKIFLGRITNPKDNEDLDNRFTCLIVKISEIFDKNQVEGSGSQSALDQSKDALQDQNSQQGKDTEPLNVHEVNPVIPNENTVLPKIENKLTPPSLILPEEPLSSSQPKPLQKPTMPKDVFREVPVLNKDDSEKGPLQKFDKLVPNGTPSAVKVIEPEKVIEKSQPRVIDVPDDGNCLLYAMGVGLRKKYADKPEIQKKLQWDIEVEKLQGNLYKSTDLLKAPGELLRKQAAAYLEENQTDGEIMIALMEGVASHLDVAKKKITEEELIIPILTMDIEELKRRIPSLEIENQLKEKNAHLASVQASVAFQKANLPSDDNLQGYIDLTKQDHVYCGVAQMFALSREYGVPVQVLYNYGKPNQYAQIFNDEVNTNNSNPLPILTVAHVNGNHFKFLDD